MQKYIETIVGSETEFERLKKTVKQAELPIALQSEDPIGQGVTLEDIRQFANRFRKDTGLEVTFHMFTCNKCDRLHMLMEIHEPVNE